MVVPRISCQRAEPTSEDKLGECLSLCQHRTLDLRQRKWNFTEPTSAFKGWTYANVNGRVLSLRQLKLLNQVQQWLNLRQQGIVIYQGG